MKPFWSVSYGPDKSHLWEAKICDRLADANGFIGELEKPWRLYRHTRVSGYSLNGTDTLIAES